MCVAQSLLIFFSQCTRVINFLAMSIFLFPSNIESTKTKEEEIYLQNNDVKKATKVC